MPERHLIYGFAAHIVQVRNAPLRLQIAEHRTHLEKTMTIHVFKEKFLTSSWINRVKNRQNDAVQRNSPAMAQHPQVKMLPPMVRLGNTRHKKGPIVSDRAMKVLGEDA